MYHPSQNLYTHDIIITTIFVLVFDYSYSFQVSSELISIAFTVSLFFSTDCSYRRHFPSGTLKNLAQWQLHDLMVFEPFSPYKFWQIFPNFSPPDWNPQKQSLGQILDKFGVSGVFEGCKGEKGSQI